MLIAEIAGSVSPGVLMILGLGVFGGMAGAWFFQKIHFPQVVGYIVIGLLLGETGFGLVHPADVENLRLLNLFALGIIGFLVGGELKLEMFRKYAKEFITILLGEGIAAFFLVALAIPVLLAGLRWQVGTDFGNYQSLYKLINSFTTLEEFSNQSGRTEWGYMLLNVLAFRVFQSEQMVFFLSSLLIYGLFFLGFWKEHETGSIMLSLYIFGTAVERRIGSREFTLYYLLCGTLCGVASYAMYYLANTNVVLLGASGAIYALLILFSALYPRAVIYVFGIIPVQAPLLIIIYFVIELAGGLFSYDGVAHMTHLFGLLFAL